MPFMEFDRTKAMMRGVLRNSSALRAAGSGSPGEGLPFHDGETAAGGHDSSREERQPWFPLGTRSQCSQKGLNQEVYLRAKARTRAWTKGTSISQQCIREEGSRMMLSSNRT